MKVEINTVVHGDCLEILRGMKGASVDAVITDPPYSSGGQYRGDRARSTRKKYITSGPMDAEYAKHSFTGDNLDQRAWTSWAAEWMSLAREATKEGGVLGVFTDWRQIGAITDAVQWAGWIWRGIVVWDKKNARPQPNRPKQQCEFIVWGSNGPLDPARNAAYMPGIFIAPPPSREKRRHQTEKPIVLMQDLVHLCEAGGIVLDPFAGSGSTLEAAILEGYSFIGIEKDAYYFSVAQERVREALRGISRSEDKK